MVLGVHVQCPHPSTATSILPTTSSDSRKQTLHDTLWPKVYGRLTILTPIFSPPSRTISFQFHRKCPQTFDYAVYIWTEVLTGWLNPTRVLIYKEQIRSYPLTNVVLLFRRLPEFEELDVDVHLHPDDEAHLQEDQLQLTNT